MTIEQITPVDARGAQLILPRADGWGYGQPFDVAFPEFAHIRKVVIHRQGISFFAECRSSDALSPGRRDVRTFVFVASGYAVPTDADRGAWKYVDSLIVERYSDHILHLYERPYRVPKRRASAGGG